MKQTEDFNVMVFDTYTPRDDATSRNYDAWLEEVDCPLFNSLDMIADYTCWKVDDAKGTRAPAGVGAGEPFTYFGFFGLKDASGFGAMMADPKAEAHVPVWVSEWSRYPDAEDMSRNFFFSLAERVHHTAGTKTNTILVVPFVADAFGPQDLSYAWASNPDVAAALSSSVYSETWIVTEQLQGEYGPNGLDLFYLDDASQASKVWDLTPNAILGSLVAGPR